MDSFITSKNLLVHPFFNHQLALTVPIVPSDTLVREGTKCFHCLPFKKPNSKLINMTDQQTLEREKDPEQRGRSRFEFSGREGMIG